MAIKMKFDANHCVKEPTIVLATKSQQKIGVLPAVDIAFNGNMKNGSTLSFKVYKYDNGQEYAYWDKITDFKTVWCKEWDLWFEIYVDVDESENTIKNINCKSLGEAELSQIMIYDMEVNTEEDMKNYNKLHPEESEYPATVLYNPSNTKISLLHRLLEKAPHYTIKYVDQQLQSIQRTFSFDNKSLYDALQEVAEEIDCLIIINSGTDSSGNIERSISVYDLENYCLDCHKRGTFTTTCEKCGGTNIKTGYGNDTTIFVSREALANDIKYSTDTDSVKNCFRLEAGDDLMTATVKNCNPNGSNYLWNITEDMKKDMSQDLVEKLEDYDEDYDYYSTEYSVSVPSDLRTKYNLLVTKYNGILSELSEDSENLNELPQNIVGYTALSNIDYDVIDFYMLLHHKLMPSPQMLSTTAAAQLALLIPSNLSPVAVTDLDIVSESTVNSAVLAMAKTIVDNRYQVKVDTENSSYNKTTHIWTGRFRITNYSNDEDYAYNESSISLTITDDYEEYLEQQINKTIIKEIPGVNDIVSLFNLDISEFRVELANYGLSSLNSFRDCCEGCVNILIEQGASAAISALHDSLYVPYYNKLNALIAEIAVREDEISTLIGIHNDNVSDKDGVKDIVENQIAYIQKELNFQDYLGSTLWLELSSYRREDTYSNKNYVSDGLNNAEIFEKAFAFIEVARKEIYKSSMLQHSISSSLKNLLVMEEFSPLVDMFELGNWIWVKVDGEIYKLRLIEYQIDFNNLDDIQIVFSDVIKVVNGYTDLESIMKSAQSMSSTYGYVSRQAEKGSKGNEQMQSWFNDGLALTQLKIVNNSDDQNVQWDNHGILCRKFNPDIQRSRCDTCGYEQEGYFNECPECDGTNISYEHGSYEDEQLKIINSTIAFTNDSWKSTKTAVGKFYYRDMLSTGNPYIEGYGINAEAVVGRLLLGEELGIYNVTSGGTLSMSFNQNGLKITNNHNTVTINPNDTQNSVFTISRDSDSARLIYFNSDGSGKIGGWSIGQYKLSSQFSIPKTVYSTITLTRYVEVENPIVSDLAYYYEYNGTSYTATSDTSINTNKTYYTNRIPDVDSEGNQKWGYVEVTDALGNPVYEYNQDNEYLPVVAPVNQWVSIYYELSGTTYTLTQDSSVDSNKTYYTNYLMADTTTQATDGNNNPLYELNDNNEYIVVMNPNADWLSVYYEESGGVYTLTSDVTVDANKTYYSPYKIDVDGVPVAIYVQAPVQKTEYQMLYKTEKYDVIIESQDTEYYDNFTTLNTQGSSNTTPIALAIGATAENDLSTGKIKLFNNGEAQSIRNIVYNATNEPSVLFKRDINSNTAEGKIFFENITPNNISSNNNIIAFGFKGETESNYTYSAFINKYGFFPYLSNTYSIGTSSYRWNNLYISNINAIGTVCIGNTLQMVDTKNKKKSVLRLYPYNGNTDYSNSQLVIQADGNMYIGSGESAGNLYSVFNKNYGNNEYMYVSADSNVYIYTNCQTISQRKGFQFTNGGHFSPYSSGKAYLGLSGYKWKSVYATTGSIQTSDRKVKKNIQPIANYKPLVMNTLPVEYMFTFEGSDRLHYGVISQQFKEAMEKAGIENCGIFCCDVSAEGEKLGYTRENAPEEYLEYGIRYEEITPLLLAMVRDHENTIQGQGLLIEELRNEIDSLKSN